MEGVIYIRVCVCVRFNFHNRSSNQLHTHSYIHAGLLRRTPQVQCLNTDLTNKPSFVDGLREVDDCLPERASQAHTREVK